MRSSVIIFLVGLALIDCGNKSVNESKSLLKNFNDQDVAKYAISAIMTQSPDIISVVKKDDILWVSYIRNDDGKRFDYKVKLYGNKVIWGNFDGRWSDNIGDGRISFVETGDSLRIIQAFDGDSAVFNDFHKRD